MKTVNRFLVILFILMIVTSCGTKKKITRIHERDSIYITKDSVIYKDIVKIDTQFIPADHAYIEALFECDSLGMVKMREITRLENGMRATANISFRNGVLSVECICDSMEIYTLFRDRYQKEISIVISDVEESTDTEKIIIRSPWWLRFWWIWVVLIGVIVIAVKKIFLK